WEQPQDAWAPPPNERWVPHHQSSLGDTVAHRRRLVRATTRFGRCPSRSARPLTTVASRRLSRDGGPDCGRRRGRDPPLDLSLAHIQGGRINRGADKPPADPCERAGDPDHPHETRTYHSATGPSGRCHRRTSG